ncbi:MAG: ABC transporter ATP-binding protein [Catonella sp.]|nr:ABC transporter ATP-binding protein [Catonella sp.]MDY6356623.1 ABC transporter ATP-binding protein [Catonella sp.]
MLRITKKMFSVFDRGQKIKIAIIFVLMIIGAGFETIGVSLIVPLMTSIMKPDFFETNKYAVWAARVLDIHSTKTFVIALLIGMIFIYIFKNVFLYFEYYVQQRFICNNRVLMQHRIMSAILNRPYEYFVNVSTGEVQRTIISDVEGVFLLLGNFMSLATELVVSIVLCVAIFVINPTMAALVLAIVTIEILVIGYIIKPKMRKIGVRQRDISANLNKWIIQSVSGIKETKVAEKEGFFLENYQRYASENAKLSRASAVISNAPRLIIEAVTISAMLAFIAILLFRGQSVEKLMPQLSAFAVAAVRLLPSANRISSSANMFPAYEPNLDALIKTLNDMKSWDAERRADIEQRKSVSRGKLTLNDKCELSHVTFAYENSDRNILTDANMVIPAGASVGIVGPSGAGKTTTVDILLGLLNPQEGNVLSDGVDIMTDYPSWLSRISYIPQSTYMIDDTVAANVAFGVNKENIDRDKVMEVLREARLEDVVNELPDGIDTEIGERGMRLSGGQRQRIGIARALYTDPDLLVFDEATSALDNATEAEIMESINSLHGRKTMVIIAHRLTTVSECDMIYTVDNEKIKCTTDRRQI